MCSDVNECYHNTGRPMTEAQNFAHCVTCQTPPTIIPQCGGPIAQFIWSHYCMELSSDRILVGLPVPLTVLLAG